MRHAEEVTFGGSGLDRAAELRGDIPALAAALQSAETRTMLIWRGKPLVSGPEDALELVRLPLTHPVLAEARAERRSCWAARRARFALRMTFPAGTPEGQDLDTAGRASAIPANRCTPP